MNNRTSWTPKTKDDFDLIFQLQVVLLADIDIARRAARSEAIRERLFQMRADVINECENLLDQLRPRE